MSTAAVTFEGTETTFHVDDSRDHIQGFHAHGKFYEMSQLLAHRELIHRRAIVVDVGANVGNHTLFYAKYTRAVRIYPVEANPVAVELLRRNVASNRNLSAPIDLRHIGLAVGAAPGHAKLVKSPDGNLGGTVFASSPDDCGIALVRLDDLGFDGRVGFLKIDVEGGELDVLAGADRLVAEFRPALAIEVCHRNEPGFWNWVQRHNYAPVQAFFEYAAVKNYILIPKA